MGFGLEISSFIPGDNLDALGKHLTPLHVTKKLTTLYGVFTTTTTMATAVVATTTLKTATTTTTLTRATTTTTANLENLLILRFYEFC